MTDAVPLLVSIAHTSRPSPPSPLRHSILPSHLIPFCPALVFTIQLSPHRCYNWSSLTTPAALDPRGLPGAVLYPRDTADVVAIVKVASQYGIPLIPFSGGTSLEGQTGSVGLGNSPKARAKVERAAAAEKARREGGAALAAGDASAVDGFDRVTVDDLEAGRTWVLDFAENMNQVIAIHQNDLDIVVQPGISYGAVNEILAEHATKEGKNALFFPVDPAPGAMVSRQN